MRSTGKSNANVREVHGSRMRPAYPTAPRYHRGWPTRPVLSFLVPAHDEQATIVATLASIHDAARGRDYEVVVVDDASSDRTAELAAEHGARVVTVA
ncbi:MAG: glycosyltransferase, partial [Planctomycetes bacterium]|nr:glycosyltransferase [Planctomycetota bacterium]